MTLVHSDAEGVSVPTEGQPNGSSDLPTPKYRIGQTVFYADTEKVTEKLPCPDCLGSKKWRLDLPSGDAHEVPCQRCCGGMTYSRIDDLPSLDYVVFKPVARRFVVDNIEARTKSHHGRPEITYWSSGNGGRGEEHLHATEESALALAGIKAAEQNVKAEASVERIHQRNIGSLKLEDARFDQFKNGLWNAWYAYRDLIGKLEEHLDKDDGRDANSTLEDLRDDMRWEMDYRERQDRPLDRLVEAVEAALAGDSARLADAYAALPDALKTTTVNSVGTEPQSGEVHPDQSRQAARQASEGGV